MVLKVCRAKSTVSSGFWLAVNALFSLQFPTSLGNIEFTHQFIAQHGEFNVPDFVASAADSFVLSRYVEGEDISQDSVTDNDILALAKHMAKLHQQTTATWGSLNQPQQVAQLWDKQLHTTLQLLRAKNDVDISDVIFESVISQAEKLQIEQFAPLMLDFRWDQCRRSASGAITLIDLDAFARGPIELDFVLLEYLLSPSQLTLFCRAYQLSSSIPDLTECRACYRLLLFFMNVLGETDLDHWMKQPHFF